MSATNEAAPVEGDRRGPEIDADGTPPDTSEGSPPEAAPLLRFSAGRNEKRQPGSHDHEPLELELVDLIDRLAPPAIGPKGSAGYYLPALFEPGERTKDARADSPALIAIDLDAGGWTAATIREAIPGVAFVCHTTASHTPGAPRWRVVFPLACELDAESWGLLARAIARWFTLPDGTRPDACSERIAQPVYWPTIAAEGDPFEVDGALEAPWIGGEFAEKLIEQERAKDAEAEAQAAAEREARAEARRRREARYGTAQGSVIDAWNAAHPIEDTLDRFGYVAPRAPGGRWTSPNSLSGKGGAVKVWPEEGRFYSWHNGDAGTPVEHGDAFDLFVHFEHGGDVSAAVRAAAVELGLGSKKAPEAQGGGGDTAPARAVVTVNEGQPRDVIASMVTALVGANDPPALFRRAGGLARIGRSELGVGEAQTVGPDDYLNVFSAAADYRRFDSRSGEYHTSRPTRELMAAAIARALAEDRLPPLRAVTSAPIIHEDGSLVDHEGYDPATRAHYRPREGFRFGRVPEKPTTAQAERALETLLAPFDEIPFATDTDRANFLAVVITSLCRAWFPTVPLVVLEAPIQASGKTLIAQAIRMLVEGTGGVGSAPESGRDHEAEWRKRITSALLGAPSVAVFDNITGTLGGPALAALATSATWEDRILGRSETVELWNGATWLFTSNNAALDADLIRRTVFVRLDPRDAAPHLRTGFRIPDLLGHVGQHRGELLAAACTVVRHWITAGRPPAPDSTPTLGSFEKWSRTVPAILAAVGIDGVLGDLDERAALMRDPADDEAGTFLEGWHANPRLRDRTTARALVDEAIRGFLDLPGAVTHDQPIDARGPAVARSLGRWLRFRRDRIIPAEQGSYAVRKVGGTEKRGLLWGVERI